jgi:hypothetical protein
MKTAHFWSTLITLAAMGSAMAAQPGPQARPQTQDPVGGPVGSGLVLPGVLSSLGAAPNTLDAGKPVSFALGGSGFCKVSITFGDGMGVDREGTLPYNIEYAYSTATMLSYESVKPYTASVTPQGSCKATTALQTVVHVKNPNMPPQGSGISNGGIHTVKPKGVMGGIGQWAPSSDLNEKGIIIIGK